MRSDGDPHLKRADYLASEMRDLSLRHDNLADDHDWKREYLLADYHRRLANYYREDADKYDTMGKELVPMF
jgi:hypothetical protein